jgi:hypothetical protein
LKKTSDPMNLEDVEKILNAAAHISNHRRFIIAGSLSSIGAVMTPPPEMAMSRDLDFYPQLDPGRGFLEIAKKLGEGSEFHQQHGYYADPISPKLLALPEGWQNRLAPISLKGGVIAIFLDPNDVAVGKLVRGNVNDLHWIEAGLKEGILNSIVISDRLRDAHTVSFEESLKAKELLESLHSGDEDEALTQSQKP